MSAADPLPRQLERQFVEFTLCGECGSTVSAGLCSYGCKWDDVADKDRPTVTRRYVAVDAVTRVLRERGETMTSRRSRGAFFHAAEVVQEVFE